MQVKNLALFTLAPVLSKGKRSAEEETTMLDRKNAYWLSQATGWTVFALINTIVIALFDTFTFQRGVLLVVLCLLGIAATHSLRSVIKKFHWLNLPLVKNIPRVLTSSILIGSLIYSVYYFLIYLTDAFPPERLTTPALLGGMFNMSSVILLWALIYFAVHYFENYKKAEIESLIWENAVKEFELRTLKAQLNPHFMFNAMNSIRALIREEPQSAQTAVTKLSNILRYSLKIERTETVPLEEELATVSDYLDLERIRFEERLKYDIQIDPKSAKIEIPPMMVQTLVENGIKHGISKRTEGGEIVIQTLISDSKLHIRIKNSGNIDPESLKHSSGFGIQNTKHRLSLIYGGDAYFNISNENNNTVSAELVIPTGGINK